MKRVILVTGHYYESKRKAGFHWLADAYWRAGWEVIFLTVGLSWLSFLRQDHRLQYPVLREAGHMKWVSGRLGSYVCFTPVHPVNLYFDWANAIGRKLFAGYHDLPLGEVEKFIPGADTIIFESTYGLVLFDKFKLLNSRAKYIYRVSDDLRLLRVHPLIREAEMQNAQMFDLVSVPSQYLYKRFADLPNAAVHYHGICKDLFENVQSNPYRPNTTNLVFVGNSRFDHDFLRRVSRLFPEWNFHIIGPIAGLPKEPNIFIYGEVPFSDTIPLIKFADIGLHTLEYVSGAESFTDSLKVIQYQYCRLPVVAPEYLRSSRNCVFYYRPGDDTSIQTALMEAKNCDCSVISTESIYSWDELIEIYSGWNSHPGGI